MNVSLVETVPEDVHFFVALNELSYKELIERQFGRWDARVQAEAFLEKWRDSGFLKVLVDKRQVGGLWVRHHKDSHELREIQILPEFRNQGIGTYLLRREIERARAAGKSLRLRVLLENPAIRLYRRMGFRIVRTDDVRHYMELNPD